MSHFPRHFEENYLKAIFKLSKNDDKKLNNIALSKYMELNPATVLEMVRKMSDRGLVQILPDKTLELTEKGNRRALQIIRKHRLWEVFLVEKLEFKWNEVHNLAEQLEHIESDELIDRLENYLAFPHSDPHGDPIPDKNGHVKSKDLIPLYNAVPGSHYRICRYMEANDDFLFYADQMNLHPGTDLSLLELQSYDQSCRIQVGKEQVQLSEKAARNILVQPIN
jgi:DtxR family Mn-dependent transcriptional regulator